MDRSERRVIKVLGDDFLFHLLFVPDDKGLAIQSPRNGLGRLVEDESVEFQRKGFASDMASFLVQV